MAIKEKLEDRSDRHCGFGRYHLIAVSVDVVGEGEEGAGWDVDLAAKVEVKIKEATKLCDK